MFVLIVLAPLKNINFYLYTFLGSFFKIKFIDKIKLQIG